MRYLAIILGCLLLVNLGFTGYIYSENKNLKRDVLNLETTLDRLDVEALEKIRLPKVKQKCELSGTGDWLASLNCE